MPLNRGFCRGFFSGSGHVFPLLPFHAGRDVVHAPAARAKPRRRPFIHRNPQRDNLRKQQKDTG
ncbi:hypothetical protein CDN97_21325 [Pantoea sp. AMG 501]|nr:hypothetical protein CDN97_21325 [Pantoea sp. AMG 501]